MQRRARIDLLQANSIIEWNSKGGKARSYVSKIQILWLENDAGYAYGHFHLQVIG